jgi:hypothetical protein
MSLQVWLAILICFIIVNIITLFRIEAKLDNILNKLDKRK